MEYYRSIIEKYTSKQISDVPNSLETTSTRESGKLEILIFHQRL